MCSYYAWSCVFKRSLQLYFSQILCIEAHWGVCMFLYNRLSSSAQTRSWCVLLTFSLSRLAWTFLNAFYKAKFESNGDKASTVLCICTFYVYGSMHHNICYEITNICNAAICSQFYSTARFTLHVSGVLHTHHQEFNF